MKRMIAESKPDQIYFRNIASTISSTKFYHAKKSAHKKSKIVSLLRIRFKFLSSRKLPKFAASLYSTLPRLSQVSILDQFQTLIL